MARHYFPHSTSHPFRLSRHSFSHVPSLVRIAGHRLLIDLAVSLIGIFMPIFWFTTLGSSLSLTLLFLAINFAFKLPFFVIAANIFSRIGLKKSMYIGVLGYISFFSIVYMIDKGMYSSLPLMLAIAVFSLMIVTVFYWAPFHLDMTQSMSKGKRGKQLGYMKAIQRLMLVLAPLLGGYLISLHGYNSVFAIGIGLIVLSMIPLAFTTEVKVTYEFTFLETWQKLFSKKFRPMTLSMIAYGAESIVGAAVWPIFLFSIFKGNFIEVGGFAALIVSIGLVLELFMGREADKISTKKLIRIGTGMNALGWIWKGFAHTVTGVFAASTFHTFGIIFLRTPLDVLTYEQAADSGHYIDEYTVIREMALNLGRAMMLFFLIGVTATFSISASFFIAAIVSFGINLVVNYHAKNV